VDEVGDVNVPAHGVDKVVPAFAIAVPFATFRQHREIMVRQLDPRCHRQGPAVKAVEGIAPDIVGSLWRLAYSRNNDEVGRL
jgi:hypothetical protein